MRWASHTMTSNKVNLSDPASWGEMICHVVALIWRMSFGLHAALHGTRPFQIFVFLAEMGLTEPSICWSHSARSYGGRVTGLFFISVVGM